MSISNNSDDSDNSYNSYNSDNSINYIFFGHQNRFKEYIVDSFNKCIEASNKTQKASNNTLYINLIDKKIRFCNGSILKLTISKTNDKNLQLKISLSLIYDGDTKTRKKKKFYWVTPRKPASSSSSSSQPSSSSLPSLKKEEELKELNEFNEKIITCSINSFNSNFKSNIQINDIQKPLDLYFVRHGFSDHNKKSFWQKLKLETNTELTGEKYIEKINELLKKDSTMNFVLNKNLNYETISKFIDNIDTNTEYQILGNNNNNNINIIVVFFIKIIFYYLLEIRSYIHSQSVSQDIADEFKISIYIYITILIDHLKEIKLLDGKSENKNNIDKNIINIYKNLSDNKKNLSDIKVALQEKDSNYKNNILTYIDSDDQFIEIRTGIEKIVYSILIGFIKNNKHYDNIVNLKKNSDTNDIDIVHLIKLKQILDLQENIKRIEEENQDEIRISAINRISLNNKVDDIVDDNDDDDDDEDDVIDIVDEDTKEKIANLFRIKNDNNLIIRSLLDVISTSEKNIPGNVRSKNDTIQEDIKKILTKPILRDSFDYFLYNVLLWKFINNNGILQSQKAGFFFSSYFGNNILNGVFVSDLIRTQQTAGYFLSQLNSKQFPQNTPIVVLPCFHELRNKEKDGQMTVRKVLSQATRIISLGTTHGAMNRENNTNCRATSGEKSWSINPYVRKDCSMIMVNKKSMPIDWSIYHDFYKGYRDQNNFGRKACKDRHFIGIFLNYIEQYNKIDNRISESDHSFITAEQGINLDGQASSISSDRDSQASSISSSQASSISSDRDSQASSISSDRDTEQGSFDSNFQKEVVSRITELNNTAIENQKKSSWWPFGSFVSKGGRTKRKRVSVNKKRTKKNYRSKSKKVRKIRRVNKSKKGNKKATRRK